ncbi:hypothetical protein D2M30_4010 [Bacillus amyloliquefaciens]|nr:hypothetical protein D2M30_4010 [Bacillus amyloliquefaciens]
MTQSARTEFSKEHPQSYEGNQRTKPYTGQPFPPAFRYLNSQTW